MKTTFAWQGGKPPFYYTKKYISIVKYGLLKWLRDFTLLIKLLWKI